MVMLVMVMMTTVVLVTMTMMLVRAPVSLLAMLAMLAVAIAGVRLCEALRDEKVVVPCDNLVDTVRMVFVHEC